MQKSMILTSAMALVLLTGCEKAEAPAPAVDLSQFSLAPVGSDMGQAKAAPPAPPPDTSHLKLQD